MSTISLVARGAIDQYLTGNPQISFFKTVYRRYTPFSLYTLPIDNAENTTYDDQGNWNDQSPSSLISSNLGDLLCNVWLQLNCSGTQSEQQTTNGYFNWMNNTACAVVETYSLYLENQCIDKQDSNYLDIYNELYQNDYIENTMLNKHPLNPSPLATNHQISTVNNTNLQMNIDFKFWFCRNSGQAIPLLCLNNNNNLKITYTLRNLQHCINASHSGIMTASLQGNCRLFGKFAKLSKDERIRFLNSTHEYLIEQVNHGNSHLSYGVNGKEKVNLNFNGPVKKIIWYFQYNKNMNPQNSISQTIDHAVINPTYNSACNNHYFNYAAAPPTNSIDQDHPGNNFITLFNENHYPFINKTGLKINGQDYTNVNLSTSYFSNYEFYRCGYNMPNKFLYMYSFALNPKDHQPSGTLNFSEISNAQITWEGLPNHANPIKGDTPSPTPLVNINVYYINYNILRFASGQAGLAYIN